jgi:hypothetical protein
MKRLFINSDSCQGWSNEAEAQQVTEAQEFHLANKKTKKNQMKRFILLAFVSLFAMQGFAQKGSLFSFYGGAGLALTNNYDAGISGGIEYLKGIFDRTAFGATIFYQGYNTYEDNEQYAAKNGVGNAGVTILNKSSYIFFAPKIIHDIGRSGLIKYYFDAGVGYSMSGTETMRKWDRSVGGAYGIYDSTIDTSPNITKLVMRIGFGLTEYMKLGGKWWFTFTEDFGFVPQNISSTVSTTDPERTIYTPHTMKPGYISLQIGFSHSKN